MKGTVLPLTVTACVPAGRAGYVARSSLVLMTVTDPAAMPTPKVTEVPGPKPLPRMMTSPGTPAVPTEGATAFGGAGTAPT